MGFCICNGAILNCPFGSTSSSLVIANNKNNVVISGKPVATIMDNVLATEVQPFGMCSSLANPAVAAATAAASGVLTPMPCIPITPAPWVTGSPTVLIADIPVLSQNSFLTCIWGGRIEILNPGQMTVETK